MAKCDGRRFIDVFVNPLIKSNSSIKYYTQEHKKKIYYSLVGYPPKLDNLVKREEEIAHQGWDSRISDKTYIVSILRDPIERAVSWYTWLIETDISKKIGLDKEIKIHLNKEQFINCVKNDTRFHNFYSKMLLNDFTNYGSLQYDNSLLKNKDNVEMVTLRAKRINLLMKMKDFNSFDKMDISRKITEDLGCDIVYPDMDSYINPDLGEKTKPNPYTVPASKALYSSLTEDDKSDLSIYFELDYSIYNDDSLFWKP
jgi:hypothetical protein